MKTIFLCSAMDCEWLCETHLKHAADIPAFKSFMLTGNEDCPVKLELYARKLARITDKPVAVFVLCANGEYVNPYAGIDPKKLG